MAERFAVSSIEMCQLDPEDFKITRQSNWWIIRMLRFANDLGLQGKKIKDVFRIDETFANQQTYYDFTITIDPPALREGETKGDLK